MREGLRIVMRFFLCLWMPSSFDICDDCVIRIVDNFVGGRNLKCRFQCQFPHSLHGNISSIFIKPTHVYYLCKS